MIDTALLTNNDIGRWVIYHSTGGDKTERGRIKNWNDSFIFVVYECNGEWYRFDEFTAAATKPKELEFA